jgi:hypothetical protein
MTKEEFIFKVQKVDIYYDFPVHDVTLINDNMFKVMEQKDGTILPLTLTKDYKGIVRSDTGKLISIVSNTYNLTTNEEVINKTLGVFEMLGLTYIIDPIHSHISDNRMILNIVIKDICINDGVSPISLAMFIHNSYDMTTKFRFRFGTFRYICSNGSVIGFKELCDPIEHKHTPNFYIDDIKREVERAIGIFPRVGERIEFLKTQVFTYTPIRGRAESVMGSEFTKYMKKDYEREWKSLKTLYDLYLIMTWYVTHKVVRLQQETYFNKIAKVFGL